MWKKLLAWLESEHAYTGAKTADAVIAFMSEKGLNASDESGEAYTPTQIVKAYQKAVTVTIQDDATGEGMAVTGEPKPMGGEPEGASEDDEDVAEKMEDEEEKGDYRKSQRPARGKNINQMLKAGHAPSAPARDSERARYEAKVKRHGVGARKTQAAFHDVDAAEAVGAAVRDAYYKQKGFSNPHGRSDSRIMEKTGTTVNFTSAGALIEGQYVADLIDIRQEYGVFPRIIGTDTMTEGTLRRPRTLNNLVASYIDEDTDADEQDLNFDDVRLVANDLIALVPFSNNLLNDSAISLGEEFAKQSGRAFGLKSDQTCYSGTGNATSGGFVGLAQALKDKSATANPEDSPVLQLVSGNAWSNITRDDFYNMRGLLGHIQGAGDPVMVCHKAFFEQVLVGLFEGLLGTNKADIANSALGRAQGSEYDFILDGTPGYFSQVMPKADANDSVPLIYGHFDLAASYGEVTGGLEIATSEHVAFKKNATMWRATMRHALNVHDVYTDNEEGVLVGLITEDA